MNRRHTVDFDFGENWVNYAESKLTPELVEQARSDFSRLMSHTSQLDGDFLDIGYGQGLSLLLAAEMGFRVTGLEINKKNLIALEKTKSLFQKMAVPTERLIIGSILDDETVSKLTNMNVSGYHVVHSWGVLHHTGNLHKAFNNTAKLVRPGGYLVVAIYRKHWTSPFWKRFKYIFCASPEIIRKMLVVFFLPLLFIRFLTSRTIRSSVTRRGMHFFFDLIDWLGGFPYEYEDANTIVGWANSVGMKQITIIRGAGWTGCNEYIFKRPPT